MLPIIGNGGCQRHGARHADVSQGDNKGLNASRRCPYGAANASERGAHVLEISGASGLRANGRSGWRRSGA
jgi:hypothetical protein